MLFSKKHIRTLSKNKFIRNVTIVASGTAGAQAITMAFSPVITRLYGPEAFGLLGTFIAITAVLMPMAALTYPIAIVLPKSHSDAQALARLSIGLATAITFLVMALLGIWGDWFAVIFGIEKIKQYLLLIPLAMFFSALHQVMEQWLIRYNQFKITARVAVLQSIVMNCAKAGVGTILPIGGALITLQTLTGGLHALLLWLSTRIREDNTLNRNEKKSSIKKLASQYKDFPLYRAPEVTINAASQSLPILILAGLFGPTSAGFYTLARTVMGVPAGLIGKSVGDVLYPRLSQAANEKEALFPLVCKATILLALAGILPFLTVVILGPSLFSFVFGAQWVEAGEYSRWLAIWMFFLFINNPSLKALPLIKAQAFQLFYTILMLISRTVALYVGYSVYNNDVVAVALFSVSGAVLNLALILIIAYKCKRYDSGQG